MKFPLFIVTICLIAAVTIASPSCTWTSNNLQYNFASASGKEFIDESSTIRVSICGNLPPTICAECNVVVKNMGAGTILASGTLEPPPVVVPAKEGDDFLFALTYSNAPASEQCPNRTTTLRFKCGADDTPVIGNSMSCDSILTVTADAACKTTSAGGLSGGAIFLIIFFSVLAGYFVIGFLVCKFVLKKEGVVNSIPQNAFWCALPGLYIAGIKFAIGKCTKKNTNSEYSSSDSGYGSTEEV